MEREAEKMEKKKNVKKKLPSGLLLLFFDQISEKYRTAERRKLMSLGSDGDYRNEEDKWLGGNMRGN